MGLVFIRKFIYYKLRNMNKRQIISHKKKSDSDEFGVKYWKMWGISFFSSNINRLLKILVERTGPKSSKIWLTTVNTEFVMEARSDQNFMDIINKSDIKLIDGIGLIWAKEVLKSRRGIRRLFRALTVGTQILRGKWRNELITGADLITDLSEIALKKNQKIFLLGGWENRAQESGDFLAKKFPGLKYDFCRGEPEVENEMVINQINKFEPDYLLVAYGMKRQEKWIENNLSRLKVKMVVGVGRSFDYYSGALRRAPSWVRRMGLEWLYSLFMEPKRWKRQLVLPKFIWMVMSG